jgi:putative selenate reductase
MSELMTPISFRQLMTWITAEYDREGSVFGVHRPFHPSGKTLPIFGETIETPFGRWPKHPAGPEHRGRLLRRRPVL